MPSIVRRSAAALAATAAVTATLLAAAAPASAHECVGAGAHAGPVSVELRETCVPID